MLSACNQNSITGRRQLTLFPENLLQQQSLTQYQSFLKQNRVVPLSGSKDAEMVNRVGRRIAGAISNYYEKKKIKSDFSNYKWEFNLVENKEINAWCMPGGKVVVYSGLLPIAQNEASLAVVLGHEITHAIALHGNERLSQAAVAQGLQIAGDFFTQDSERANALFNNVFGPTAAVGVLLPNSRKQEHEADEFGLIFAAMAGYDPREAIGFWKRMSAAGGTKPPEFLATHPSDENRIKALQSHMNEAMTYYEASKRN
jgi:predicted Zn-dependent protease